MAYIQSVFIQCKKGLEPDSQRFHALLMKHNFPNVDDGPLFQYR